jgi:hypothetical protein
VEGGKRLLRPLFAAHRHCFNAHVEPLVTAAERVSIPHEGDTLPGYLFGPADDQKAARP